LEKILLDREKSLLPESQPAAELIVKERRKKILYARIRYLKNKLALYEEKAKTKPSYIFKIIKRKNELDKLLAVKNKLLEKLRKERSKPLFPEEKKKEFVQKCRNEGCNGFLSTRWKCGICLNYTCNKCMCIKKEGHECKDEDIETAKIIMKECKACPSCDTYIFKIEGCDQMFCTICHKAFNWKTGQIETGIIHNPHYFEYLRTHNITRVNTCEGIENIYYYSISKLPEFNKLIEQIFRVYFDTNVRYDYIFYNLAFKELRVKFILGDIDEETFKRRIQMTEKKKMLCTEVADLINTYKLLIVDLLNKFRNDCLNDKENVEEANKEYCNLYSYMNDEMIKIGKLYKQKVPVITANAVINI